MNIKSKNQHDMYSLSGISDVMESLHGFDDFKYSFAILIVDDNEDNVYTLQRRLLKDGYQQLLIARDGFQALEAIENYRVQLVLLDIMMPGMSGMDVLAKLKDKVRKHELSILMVSSADSIDNVVDCIKAGADDFLLKPFNPHLLRARIGSCVEKHWFLYQEKLYKKQIEEEKIRYFELLNAVFPPSIVQEMIEVGTVKPRNLSNVVILFADIIGFTHYTETHKPNETLTNLQIFIDICESAAIEHGIEKIKTIGDSVMVAANMLKKLDNPVQACVNWANDVIKKMQQSPSKWEVRFGIDIGDVICGIIGSREYLFDVWGNCVNTASRVQSLAKANHIYLTEQAWLKIANLPIPGELVGEFQVKGKEQACKIYKIN